jgi:hypothetical protein
MKLRLWSFAFLAGAIYLFPATIAYADNKPQPKLQKHNQSRMRHWKDLPPKHAGPHKDCCCGDRLVSSRREIEDFLKGKSNRLCGYDPSFRLH